MEIEWENPPERQGRGSSRTSVINLSDTLLTTLMENPGRWAIIFKNITYSAAANRTVKLRKLYPGYEFKAPMKGRTNIGIVYGRYVK